MVILKSEARTYEQEVKSTGPNEYIYIYIYISLNNLEMLYMSVQVAALIL